MNTLFAQPAQSLFAPPHVTFTAHRTADTPRRPVRVPSDFAQAQRDMMDEALQRGDVAAYRKAKRSLVSHYRFHAEPFRDASKFPISHDDHLASTAHQKNYHTKGDVERMSVGLNEASEWQPPLVRKMDASAGIERVSYDVELPSGTYSTDDWLSIAQRDTIHPDRDRDELPSEFTLAAIAQAEFLGCHVDDLDSGMHARPKNTYQPCD